MMSFRGWTLEMLQARCCPPFAALLCTASNKPSRCVWSDQQHRQAPCPTSNQATHPNRSAVQATCVLAGCDFLESLKGISFKTAAGFVARRKTLAGALQSIKLEKRFQLACTKARAAAVRGLSHACH